jgi:hypothetical protein
MDSAKHTRAQSTTHLMASASNSKHHNILLLVIGLAFIMLDDYALLDSSLFLFLSL